jgi:transcriptional regulator with XRE-family HTH domain
MILNMKKPLQALMLRYGLSRRDVARLLEKPLNSARGYSNSTVDNWLSGKTPISPLALELLRLKLKGRKPIKDPWQRLLRQPEPYSSQRELETDLADALNDLKAGQLPDLGRVRAQAPLRRAGYLFDLTTHFGGPAYEGLREQMQARAKQLHQRLGQIPVVVTFRADDRPREFLMDDLAAHWGLAAGTDVRRFRQLAKTGHV